MELNSLKKGMILGANSPAFDSLLFIKKVKKNHSVVADHYTITSVKPATYVVRLNSFINIEEWEESGLIFKDARPASDKFVQFFMKVAFELPIEFRGQDEV
jgi:hypothetical protein